MPFANRKLEWKIGEEGANEIVLKNVQMLDGLFRLLTKKCANPYCKWPISSLRLTTYAAPNIGDVCATCHDLYSAITFMNLNLANSNYFRNHHEIWKREQDEIKKKRRNMGLDEGSNGFA
jgi:hypothetical protein